MLGILVESFGKLAQRVRFNLVGFLVS